MDNEEHGIVPTSTKRSLSPIQNEKSKPGEKRGRGKAAAQAPVGVGPVTDADLLPEELKDRAEELREQMEALAKDLRYEEAAQVRDRLRVLEARMLEFSPDAVAK